MATDDLFVAVPAVSSVTPEQIVAIWNEIVTAPIPKVLKLTADRRAKLSARLKAHPNPETWRTAIAWVNGQGWCRAHGGGAHGNWTATIDWLCRNDGVLQRCYEQAVQEQPAREEWTCPHVPPCGRTAWQCHQATILEQAKAEQQR